MIDLKNKNILITGSKGFIGKQLVTYLLGGHFYKRLTLLDTAENDSENDNVESISGSFADPDIAIRALQHQDVVFHLAAMVGVYNCLNNKDELKRINLDATKAFIDKVVASGCEKIVFSSSSEVYGDSKKIPYEEIDAPSPVSEYAKYKIDIEKYLLQKSESSPLLVSIVRFFNIYGPKQKPEFVVPLFISMAKNNIDLMVNGNGQQTRSFTFVDDAIQGLVRAAAYDQSKYEIFNIGNNKETSILELANKTISLISGTSSKVHFVKKEDLDRYDSDRRVPSIAKAHMLLGFEPSIDLDRGLRMMLNE